LLYRKFIWQALHALLLLVATATVVIIYNTLQAKLLANIYLFIYVLFVFFILFYSFFFGSNTDTVHKYTDFGCSKIIVLHFRFCICRFWPEFGIIIDKTTKINARIAWDILV